MKPTRLYLDEAIDRGLAKNDSDIAKKIGATRTAVCDWRAGNTAPSDDHAVRLTELLGKDPGELLAECGAARAKTPETRRAWERIAARMAASGITACVLVMAIGHSPDAQASAGQSIDNLSLTVFRTGLGVLLQCFALLQLRYDGVHSCMHYGSQPIGQRMHRAMSALLGQRPVLA